MQNQVTAHTTAQVICAVPKHMVAKIKAINIQGAAGNRVIRLRREFTTDASDGAPTPTGYIEEVFRVNHALGTTTTIPEEQLKGIKAFGNLTAIADAIDGTCYITVQYEFE